MQRPQVTWLSDGKRLHLHHGPIDMIVGISGPGRSAAFDRAAGRFDSLLDELAAELARLRAPQGPEPVGETARNMVQAVAPYTARFVTPMAAVAGAGAETILSAICSGPGITKAYVNNGGDVAFHLTRGQEMTAAIATLPPTRVTIGAGERIRGIATSGWRGRSQSLGIADSVTVLAATAAQADVAATLIANAVDLPGHPGIIRQPACDLAPDSDLGARRVTTHVGPLSETDVDAALARGVQFANETLSCGLIAGASLTLQGAQRLVGHIPTVQQKVPLHA